MKIVESNWEFHKEQISHFSPNCDFSFAEAKNFPIWTKQYLTETIDLASKTLDEIILKNLETVLGIENFITQPEEVLKKDFLKYIKVRVENEKNNKELLKQFRKICKVLGSENKEITETKRAYGNKEIRGSWQMPKY